jgi:hypothetical protein
MSNNINKYHTSKIYKISSPQSEKFYIGSTIQTLEARLRCHKSAYKRYIEKKLGYCLTSFNVVKFDDCIIELIKDVKCENKKELEMIEEAYIKEYHNRILNKHIPGRMIINNVKEDKEDKEHIQYNYLNLTRGVSIEEKNEINTIKKQIEKMKEIINDIGFDLNNRNIEIKHDIFTQNIEKVIETKMNTKDFKILFGKSKITFIKSRISQFFNDYGLCFKSRKVNKRNGDKIMKITYHKLCNVDIIDNYLKRCE